MRISIDVGFGFVKAMTEYRTKVTFPSIIVKRADTGLKSIFGNSAEDYSVNYWDLGVDGNKTEERHFYVGGAGMTNGGKRTWGSKGKFDVDELKIFIATAAGILNTNNEELDLCVGLPLSFYQESSKELKSILKKINGVVTINGSREEKRLKINSVFIFAQGAGAYYAAMYDTDGNVIEENAKYVNAKAGVIEIGFRTVDYLVMAKNTKKELVLREDLSGSLEDDGMNKAYQYMEQEVSREVGRDIGIEEIEKALLYNDGIFEYRDKTINLKERIEPEAYKERATQIGAKLKRLWGVEGDLMAVIFISGGGGTTLFEELKTLFDQAVLQADSSYANCAGYLGVNAVYLRDREKQKQNH